MAPFVARPEPVYSPGDLLDGKYVVDRVIGSGGMGVVVAASHTVLRTRVAIKILNVAGAERLESVARFHREGRLAVSLASRHAAKVLDVGQLADGMPYMVMELLEGVDLGALLEERGPLPPREAVRFVLEALDALQEAHRLGIVHRDLKPANLFLANQAAGPPIVKVLDFGIASDFDTTNEPRLTRTGDVMGSPAYMSPEQMRATRQVDARSDIWSVGACLYELLTGRLPFDGKTIADLCAAVQRAAPVPPESWRPALPAPLSAIVLRCLEKDPERRFASASALARELVAWQAAGRTSDLGATAPLAPETLRERTVRMDALPGGASTAVLAPATRPPAAPPPVALSFAIASHRAPVRRRPWLPALLGGIVVAVGLAVALRVLTAAPSPVTSAVVPVVSAPVVTDPVPAASDVRLPSPTAIAPPDRSSSNTKHGPTPSTSDGKRTPTTPPPPGEAVAPPVRGAPPTPPPTVDPMEAF